MVQRAGRGRFVAREIALEVTRIVHEDVIRVELIRLATESSHRLQTKDELSFRLHTAAFHFFVVGTLGPEPFDLLENGALDLLEPVAGRGRRGDLQKSGNLSRVLG